MTVCAVQRDLAKAWIQSSTNKVHGSVRCNSAPLSCRRDREGAWVSRGNDLPGTWTVTKPVLASRRKGTNATSRF